MIYLTAETRILLSIQPVDFRKQMDGLIAICKHSLKQEPRTGCLFVFINRAKTMIRILCYQDNGYWLATKRLCRGRYQHWPTANATVHSLAADQLTLILKGLLASDVKPL